MKAGFRFATLCMFVTFIAMARDIPHVKPLPWHRIGYTGHSGIADTAETPDEHIREEQPRVSRSAV